MGKNANFVSHKKSKLKNQDGSPQLPLATALVEGEIAVNFGKDVETLSIKNESGDVVTFSSDNYYTEKKLGSGFTKENSANTVTSVIETLVGSGFTSSSITDVIIENEEIISTALIDLDDRKLDASAYTPTDLSNYYKKSETSGATELSTAFEGKADTATTLAGYGITNAYTKSETSGATELSTAFGNKANVSDLNSYADSVKYNSISHYVEFYHGTTAGTKVFEYDASPFIIDGMVQNVEVKDVTSGGSQVTCLVISFNTDAGKQDINIPISDIFDASNYYTKSQTSGATELSTAFDAVNASIEDLSGQSETVAVALNELNDNKLDASAYTPVEIIVDQVIDSGTSASTNAVATKAVVNKLIEDEETWAISLNELNNKKFGYANFDSTNNHIEFYKDSDDASTGTPISTVDLSSFSINIDQVIDSGTSASTNAVATSAVYGFVTSHTENTEIHVTAADKTNWNAKVDTSTLSNYYTKSETSGATELSTAFIAKADTATTLAGYGITNAYTKSETSGATELSTAFGAVNTSIEDLSGQSETVAVALNELNDNKLDASAYTPTDLSNYYTKSETSGATELATAFSAKADKTSDLDGLKLKKITQAEYDALAVKDPNTLYVIVN